MARLHLALTATVGEEPEAALYEAERAADALPPNHWLGPPAWLFRCAAAAALGDLPTANACLQSVRPMSLGVDAKDGASPRQRSANATLHRAPPWAASRLRYAAQVAWHHATERGWTALAEGIVGLLSSRP